MGVRSTNNKAQPSDNLLHDGHLVNWFNTALESSTGGLNPVPDPVAPAPYATPTGHDASGGQISDYSTPPGAVYRAHIFRTSGSFVISSLSPTYPANVEYLIVGGGGGGGAGDAGSAWGAGGGGAGSIVYNGLDPTMTPAPVSATTYPVVIGAGGNGIANPDGNPTNAKGNNSVFLGWTGFGGGYLAKLIEILTDLSLHFLSLKMSNLS